MKNMIRLTDYSIEEIEKIYKIADELGKDLLNRCKENVLANKYTDCLKGKTVVMFFSNTSIRTRVTFEKGIYLLGGQTILFPSETLDKKEDLQDVIGYLNNWADLVIVRHKNIEIIDNIAKYSKVPVINAMTDINHPCEMIADMYSLSKIRQNYKEDKYLFCGVKANIGLALKEASQVFGFELEQCCAQGYEIEGLKVYNDIKKAIIGKDIVCTDSLPQKALSDFTKCKVTKEIMDMANDGAVINPCPPFYRGEEVSEDVIESEYFVGYEFKKCLLNIQQAIIIYCMNN